MLHFFSTDLIANDADLRDLDSIIRSLLAFLEYFRRALNIKLIKNKNTKTCHGGYKIKLISCFFCVVLVANATLTFVNSNYARRFQEMLFFLNDYYIYI